VVNFRAVIGKQISTIKRPRIHAAKGLRLEASETKDETPQYLIYDKVITLGGKIKLPLPFISDSMPHGKVPIVGRALSYDINPANGMYQLSLDNEAIVQAPLIQQVVPDFDFLVEEDNGFDLTISPIVQILESSAFFEIQFIEVTKVSDNLLKPIRIEKILGMNYSNRHWQVTKLFDNNIHHQDKTNKAQQKQERRMTELEPQGRLSKKNNKKQPSFWDLIFVVLQPPITLAQIENLFLPHSLYPYQVHGIEFLLKNNHALLADDMGTGKTVMTIVALKMLYQKARINHTLILCPPGVLHEWERHLEEWAPELVTFFVRGGQETRELIWEMKFHVYVTAYDTLARDLESGRLPKNMIEYFDVVVLDEAHHIKNPNSRRSRAIKKLKPKIRWALTGTPIQNKLEDLASIFEFVYPRYLTPYDLYEERVKQKIEPYFLRRRKSDVMPDLPPKQRQDFWLDLDPKQKVIYEQVEHDIQNEIEALGYNVTKQHIFAKIQKLKQLCNFAPDKLTSPKLELLKEQVEDILESGNKIIIFSQYIDEGVKKLEETFKSYGTAKIMGGQTDAVRIREIERFKHSKDVSILIASLKSGGEGLNLTEASYVVHFDHWWNPATMWQAEDRVHRRGQTHGVNVFSYWMSGTIDERIYNILKRKGLLIENVVDSLSEDQIDESLSIDDLLGILGIKRAITPNQPLVDSKLWQSMSIIEIREKLYDLTPKEFEELVRDLMHYLGYPNVKVTGKTGDGGIDIISTRNTENGIERVAAQCKRYKGNVGVSLARDFLGAITTDKTIIKGFLITTGDFTLDCRQLCEKSGVIQPISGL